MKKLLISILFLSSVLFGQMTEQTKNTLHYAFSATSGLASCILVDHASLSTNNNITYSGRMEKVCFIGFFGGMAPGVLKEVFDLGLGYEFSSKDIAIDALGVSTSMVTYYIVQKVREKRRIRKVIYPTYFIGNKN